ncbi:hypothetical protein [Lysobacter olei]
MFESNTASLSGPDFLEEVAEAELHAGNLVNRQAYLQRAEEWRRDRNEIERLRAELEGVKHRRPPAPAGRVHAITPTDRT